MREIFAPLDGSRAAETALPWIAYAARRAAARAYLFSVLPIEASDGEVSERAAYLEAHRHALETQGIRTEVELASGDAAQRIVARARRADLTVMTSGTVRWVISAVLDRVLRDLEGPLVVVRTSPGELRVPPDPEKILVPLDAVSYSSQVLPVVAGLAANLRSSVILCHIVPSIGGYQTMEQAPPGIARTMEERLEEPNETMMAAAAGLSAAGIDVEAVTAMGDPPQQIVRLAKRCGAGLIAMATRGRDSLDQRVMGSVANQVLESATVPCLLLNRKSDALVADPDAVSRASV